MAEYSGTTLQTAQEDLIKIKNVLELKLSEINNQRHELRATEANNPFDLIRFDNVEQAKKLLIQALMERQILKSSDFKKSGELRFAAVLEKLETQLKETTSLIAREKLVLKKLNKRLESLQEQCKSFDKIASARLEKGEMKQADNLHKIEKELTAEFQKHKKMLNHVLNTIYPGDKDMKRIIADLLQTAYENPSDYIQLSLEEHEKIVRFVHVGIIQRHPYDPFKVRFCQG